MHACRSTLEDPTARRVKARTDLHALLPELVADQRDDQQALMRGLYASLTGDPAAEAGRAIPKAASLYLRAAHTLPVGCEDKPTFPDGGAFQAGHVVVACGRKALWVDLKTGAIGSTDLLGGAIGGPPFAMTIAGRPALRLIKSDSVAPPRQPWVQTAAPGSPLHRLDLKLPPGAGSAAISDAQIGGSGRYASIVYRPPGRRLFVLHDLAVNRVAWSIDLAAPHASLASARQAEQVVDVVLDDASQRPMLFQLRVALGADGLPAWRLVEVDPFAGEIRRQVIQAPQGASDASVFLAGANRVAVTFAKPTRQMIIVDTRRWQAVWSGEMDGWPTAPPDEPSCSQEAAAGRREVVLVLRVRGKVVPLTFNPRGHGVRCVVSPDGRMAAVMNAPLLHLIEIGAQGQIAMR